MSATNADNPYKIINEFQKMLVTRITSGTHIIKPFIRECVNTHISRTRQLLQVCSAFQDGNQHCGHGNTQSKESSCNLKNPISRHEIPRGTNSHKNWLVAGNIYPSSNNLNHELQMKHVVQN